MPWQDKSSAIALLATNHYCERMSQPFNILALSGGGYFGLYTISLLADLEHQFGAPLANYFDLMAGTSIGGIIALGLAAEVPAAKIKQSFQDRGMEIFSDRPTPKTTFGSIIDFKRSLFNSKYKPDALRSVVSDLVGADTLIGDLKHRVMIPAVNLSKGKPQVFKTPHHETFKIDLHRKVVDVALATAAAPTFFPVAEIDNELFADGGLYANSPDLLAVHEAEHFLNIRISDISLLSIGTTTSEYSFSHAGGKNLGIWGWTRNQRLVNVIMASQQQSTGYMMEHRLVDRYLRLDTTQSKEQERDLALDVSTKDAQQTISAMSSATFQQYINNKRLLAFFTAKAPHPSFYIR